MDFQGQKLAETLSMFIVSLFSVIGFLYGYLNHDFRGMMSVFASGVAAAILVGVPDWPVYNKHPVKFLPPKEKDVKRGGGGSSSGSGGAKKKGKKRESSWSNLWGMF